MERKLTCIGCPIGCELTVQLEGKKVLSVQGYTCRRGRKYAEDECTNPQRTVTSTAKCVDGSVVSVKTDRTIPKEKMTECINLINQVVVPLPISIGDVIIEDAFGSKIVATQNRSL